MANKKKAKRPTKSTAKPRTKRLRELPVADLLHMELSPIRNALVDVNDKIDGVTGKLAVGVEELGKLVEKLNPPKPPIEITWIDRAIAMGDAELFAANDALADEIERRGITRDFTRESVDEQAQTTTEG